MTVQGQTRRVHLLGPAATQSRIWGDTDFLQEFIPNAAALPPPVATVVTQSVKSHKRRRFPGDEGFTVPATQRKRLNKVPAKGAGSLPGRSFSISFVDEDGNALPGTRRTFTYQGSFANLKTNIEAASDADMILYGPSGRPYRLGASST
jgi:hypothetical protein